MYKSGDKPGLGIYVCQTCFKEVEITNSEQALPNCPTCGAINYKKKD